jgi:hypothetical protein
MVVWVVGDGFWVLDFGELLGGGSEFLGDLCDERGECMQREKRKEDMFKRSEYSSKL